MKKILISFFTASVAMVILVSTATAQGNANAGKEIWNKYTCYGCHGFSGQNGPGLRLVPMRMTVDGFTKLVRGPGQPTRMPPYSEKVLSDAQLADVWAYLKSLPDAPAAKDIKLLQDIKSELK
jgi:ubiquinol-cytochrome c reductase cytochrome c subunit